MTVKELFEQIQVDIKNVEKVKWGAPCRRSESGVYIVSSSNDPAKSLNISAAPLFDDGQITAWINKLPDFRIDNKKPTVENIKERLSEFWLPNEDVLYIGKAKKLSKRVSQYYRTKIGERAPHSGGQWLEALKNIDELYVYCASVDNPDLKENDLLKYFLEQVKEIPFANLKAPDYRKPHGLTGQRESK